MHNKLVRKGQLGLDVADLKNLLQSGLIPDILTHTPTLNTSAEILPDRIESPVETIVTKPKMPLGDLIKKAVPYLGEASTILEGMKNNDSKSARAGIESALLKSKNPWGIAAGALMAGGEYFNAYSDNSTTGTKAQNAANFAMALLPGSGIANETTKLDLNDTLGSSASYTGTKADVLYAAQDAGKKLVFGFKDINTNIQNRKGLQLVVTDLYANAADMKDALPATVETNSVGLALDASGLTFNKLKPMSAELGGNIDERIKRAKKTVKNIKPKKKLGGVIESACEYITDDFCNELLNAYINAFLEGGLITTILEEVLEFKEGGLMNLIPEGSLHARLHHMSDIVDSEISDNITKKGIPVVSVEEGGQIVQQAEIEKEEIVFTKEVTDKLERFYKAFNNDKYSKAEKLDIALEAGKLLSVEIMENTDDRTNLISRVE